MSGNRIEPQRRTLDFAGFAQEFLRRNPDYVSQYRAVMRGADAAGATREQEVMASRWGLCFPVPA